MIQLTQQQLDEFFFSDPKLVMLGLSDEEMHYMTTNKHYYMAPGSGYLGVNDPKSGQLIGVIKYEWFTNIAINFHMYIRSELHGTSDVTYVANEARNHFEADEWCRKVLLMVPSSCEHIMKFAPKHGFKKEGYITQCYFWRQQPVDLVIFGLNLKEK